MAKGILGFRRLTSIGPFSYSDSAVDGTEDIEEELVNIFDRRGIEEGDTISLDEFREIQLELAQRIYPQGGDTFSTPAGDVSERDIFTECLGSKWADLWLNGFTQSTTGKPGDFEELIIRANGCAGIAGAGPRGIRVLVSTQ